jgi:hypothetical protein
VSKGFYFQHPLVTAKSVLCPLLLLHFAFCFSETDKFATRILIEYPETVNIEYEFGATPCRTDECTLDITDGMNNDIHIYGNVLLLPIFTETRTS